MQMYSQCELTGACVFLNVNEQKHMGEEQFSREKALMGLLKPCST